MSDSPLSGPIPPAKDVLALFDKANIGGVRYRTFATRTPEKSEAPRTSAPLAEASPAAAAQPSSGNHPRGALNSVFALHTRLRIDPSRPRLIVGSGATLAFVSCAGGVGKTTLCATVARALSSRVSNVLVADRCTGGIIPFFFGLEQQSIGGLQMVYPNARRAGYQMTLVAAPCEQQNAPTIAWLEQLRSESTLMLVDLPTLHGDSAPDVLDQAHVIVPLVPDVQSVASIARMEELSHWQEEGRGLQSLFVLNRFEEVRPLHREIRAHLEKLLEGRLAPVAVRESEFVPEALSLGMTVMDYAPQSPVVKDLEQLAGWLESRLCGAAEASAGKVEIA